MFCSNCGKEVMNSSVFCPYCGKQITKNTLDIKENPSIFEKNEHEMKKDKNRLFILLLIEGIAIAVCSFIEMIVWDYQRPSGNAMAIIKEYAYSVWKNAEIAGGINQFMLFFGVGVIVAAIIVRVLKINASHRLSSIVFLCIAVFGGVILIFCAISYKMCVV